MDPVNRPPASVQSALSELIAEELRKMLAPPQAVPMRLDADADAPADGEAARVSSPVLGGMAGAAPLPIVQLLTPIVPWNWPEAVIGSMPYSQFAIADSVPASLLPSVPYADSSNSFSKNYSAFLQLLDANRFALKSQLATAITRCATPIGSPSSSLGPDGWASTPDAAGINRWRPVYGLSMTAREWIAEAGTGTGKEVRLVLPFGSDDALTITDASGQKQALSLQGAAERAVITATALSQVSLTPGAWFDSGLLTLGRNGPFLPSLPAGIPYQGLLTGRVSAIIVAYNPTLQISGPRTAGSAVCQALGRASEVAVAGFVFPAPALAPTPGPVAPCGTTGANATQDPYVYSTTATGAWIVGVTIEAFH